jgi:hypothetical protein
MLSIWSYVEKIEKNRIDGEEIVVMGIFNQNLWSIEEE